MAQNDFLITLEGPGAEEAAAELAHLIRDQFEVEVTPARAGVTGGAGESPMRGDPLVVAALVLSIPGAVLATIDLAERMKLKAKVQALVDWAKGRRKNDPAQRVDLTTPAGHTMGLDEIPVARILDEAAEKKRWR